MRNTKSENRKAKSEKRIKKAKSEKRTAKSEKKCTFTWFPNFHAKKLHKIVERRLVYLLFAFRFSLFAFHSASKKVSYWFLCPISRMGSFMGLFRSNT